MVAKVNSNCAVIPRIVFVMVMSTFFGLPLTAQSVSSEAWKSFSFIKADSSIIHNDSAALYELYEKLYQLQKSKSGVVNIVHIGDSHIQADHFSGTIRQDLQRRFGNAGRGLVFPYRVARTNEPYNFHVVSNKVWKARRNVIADSSLPIGISGITIETADTAAVLSLTVKDQPGLNYAFSSLSLLHDKGNNSFSYVVCDELNCKMGYIDAKDVKDPFVSNIKLNKPMKHISFHCEEPDTLVRRCARIYGIVLKNDSAGVRYHMVGVNGAEYRHYIGSQYFVSQMKVLQPDLIILSMGTNEGYNYKFDPAVFYGQIDTLVNMIRQQHPDAELLLTTPGDSYRKTRKGRVKNPDMLKARNTIIRYCNDRHFAYWDLMSVMGGYGSMNKWYLAKLSAKDRLHFGPKGYQIQGDLLYKAIMAGYERYVALKERK